MLALNGRENNLWSALLNKQSDEEAAAVREKSPYSSGEERSIGGGAAGAGVSGNGGSPGKKKEGKKNSGFPIKNHTEDMWKTSFCQMRIELMHMMRVYNIQRAKLEYALKQKTLFQTRIRCLKGDLSKAWKELADFERGDQRIKN